MKTYNVTIKSYGISDLFIGNIRNEKFCVFDLETIGLDFINEYITQIGAIIVNDF